MELVNATAFSIFDSNNLTGPRMNVLISEDDPVFRRVLEFTIKRHGWTAFVAGDGQTAWEMLKSESVHFLITDQQMPRLTGLELLQRKAADKTVCGVPAILCTAKGLELDKDQLISQLGLVDILHKPFSPQMVVQRMDVVIVDDNVHEPVATVAG